MNKTAKVLGAAALAAVIASPALAGNPRFSSVIATLTTLSTGTSFVPGPYSPLPQRVSGGREAFMLALAAKRSGASPN
jgi:hypothetical protein